MYECRSGLADYFLGLRIAICRIFSELDRFSAILDDSVDFLLNCCFREYDGTLFSKESRTVGYRDSMVPRRNRDDVPCSQLRDLVVGSTNLENPYRLEAFELQVNPAAKSL